MAQRWLPHIDAQHRPLRSFSRSTLHRWVGVAFFSLFLYTFLFVSARVPDIRMRLTWTAHFHLACGPLRLKRRHYAVYCTYTTQLHATLRSFSIFAALKRRTTATAPRHHLHYSLWLLL